MRWIDLPFTRSRLGLILLIAATAVLFSARCNESLLTPYDDAFFAYAAKRLAADGDWLGLKTRSGFLLEKPPLAVWLEAIGVRLGGPTPAAVRIPGILLALGGIVGAYAVARRHRGHTEALVFALVLATTQQVIHYARRPVTEIYLTTWVMLALFAYVDARLRDRSLLATGVFTALAVLTKGAAGLMPIGVIIVHLTVTRTWSRRWLRRVAAALLLAIALVLPWHLAMLARFGREFAQVYFWRTQLSFLTGTSHVDPWHWSTILRKIGENYWPWLPLLLWAVVLAALRLRRRAARRPDTTLWLTWALAWAGTILVFFHLTYVKRHQYVLPAYPAFALLIAWSTETWSKRRIVHAALTAFVVAAVVVAIGTGIWPRAMDNNLYGNKLVAVRYFAAHPELRGTALVLDGDPAYCFTCDTIAYATEADAWPYSTARLATAVRAGEPVTVLVANRLRERLETDLPAGWRLRTVAGGAEVSVVELVSVEPVPIEPVPIEPRPPVEAD